MALVYTTAHQRKIFFDGNSLSELSGGNLRNGRRYPTTAYNALTGLRPALVHQGLGSTRTAQRTADFPTRIGQYSKPGDIVVFLEMVNEARDGLSAAQMHTNYLAYATQAVNNYGMLCFLVTCPAGKLLGDPADTITRTQACNDLLRSNYGVATGLIDAAAIPGLDTEAGITNTENYNNDQLHLTDIGYDLVGNHAATVIQPYI